MKSSALCTSAKNCPGEGAFAANWARPISDAAAPAFPNTPKTIFNYGKDASVPGAKRTLEGVLWFMIHGTLQFDYLDTHHPEWMLRNPQVRREGTVIYCVELWTPRCHLPAMLRSSNEA